MGIKNFILDKVAASDRLYNLLIPPFVNFNKAIFERRQHRLQAELEAGFDSLNLGNCVVSGPFLGMQFPLSKFKSRTLYPKLLGIYENELHGALEDLLRTNYNMIVDIGCADGYYAVGLALRQPSAQVICFDTNSACRDYCAILARANGVEDRVVIRSFCSAEHLAECCLQSPCFVLCDVEGFENHLFLPEFQEAYRKSVFVIEVHDCFADGTGHHLRNVFGNSHNLRLIKADPVAAKIAVHSKGLLTGLPERIVRDLVSEHRPSGMYWIVACPLEASSPPDKV